ncbi:hypothetical protein D3C73_707130 [compost metagenome]
MQTTGEVLVVGEHFKARTDLGELLAEGFVGSSDTADHTVLAQHDVPRLEHHQHQHGDDYPGVQRHGVEQEAQAAEAESRLFFVDAVGHQLRFGSLGRGIRQQLCGRTGHLGQAQFVDGAGERLVRAWRHVCGNRQVGADGHDRIECRHGHGQGRGFATVDVQRDFAALSGQRQVLPLGRVQRLGRHGALAVDFHERQALAQTDQQALRTFTAGQHQLLTVGLVQTQPGTEGEGAAGVVLQRGAGRQQQRLAAELQGATDNAVDARTGGALRGVAVGGGVLGRGAGGTVEMVERGVVRLESQLAVAGGRRFLVAVVHPDVLALTALDFRHIDPHQRHAHQRIEAFDLVVEHGLVIGADEAQVGAVFLDAVKGEVAGVQAHQQRGTAQGLVDGRALGRGVHRDLFAVVPIVLPPRLCSGREHNAQAHQEREK